MCPTRWVSCPLIFQAHKRGGKEGGSAAMDDVPGEKKKEEKKASLK